MDTTNIIIIAAIITIWTAVAVMIWAQKKSAKARAALDGILAELEARKADVEAVEAHIWQLVRTYRDKDTK